MGSDEIINEGPDFRVWQHTLTDDEQLAEVLRSRGITTVYKGDQNEVWDGALTNGTLAAALAGSNLDLQLFMHDEKLGTGDARLTSLFLEHGHRHVLSEDYYGRTSGAVWVHQDVSSGPFFMEVVSPKDFEHAAANLRRSSVLWERFREMLCSDDVLHEALCALGVALNLDEADAATRMGPAVNKEVLSRYFSRSSLAQFFYVFTKSIGYYGVAPVYPDNISMSSIRINDSEILSYIRWLFSRVAVRGALRLTPERAERREIVRRARQLAEHVERWITAHPDASVADLQMMLGEWLVNTFMVGAARQTNMQADSIKPLVRSSNMFYLRPDDLQAVAQPADKHLYFFDLALKYPAEFTDAYNDALVRVGFGLQRIKYEPNAGRYAPPFYVAFEYEGCLRRFNVEVSTQGDRTTITLADTTAVIRITQSQPVCSAYDFLQAVFTDPHCANGVAIMGKAAPFAAELRRLPGTMAMPRQGSKYTPMIDHLLSGLRQRGVTGVPEGTTVRVGTNALDALGSLGERLLRLPPYLAALWDKQLISATEMSQTWHARVEEARNLRSVLARCEYWQHVHLVKLLAANSQGRDVVALLESDARLRDLVEKVSARTDDPSDSRVRLLQMGRTVSPMVGKYLDEQLEQRAGLLRRRAELQANTPADLEQERLLVEFRLLLIWTAYVRQLVQHCEALPYLNDRPYLLSLYLTFGPAIVPALYANTHFDIEYTETLSNSVPFGA